MNRIRNHQLYALLLLSGAWSVICMPSIDGNGQLPGVLTGFLLQILFCLPMLALTRRQGSTEAVFRAYRWLGICYLLFFLLWGAENFLWLWQAAPEQFLPAARKCTAGVLIVLTCLYTCAAGLRATARCASCVLALFLLSVIVCIIGAWKRIDFSLFSMDRVGFWDGLNMYFQHSGELVIALLLLDKVKARHSITINGYLFAKAIFCACILFLSMTTGGRLTDMSGCPFFLLTTLSQPLQAQRADALYILVFVMLSVLHITLQTGMTGYLAGLLFPAVQKYAAPAALGIMLVLAWLVDVSVLQAVTAVAVPVLAFLVPLLLRTKQFLQSTHKEQSHEAI